MRVESYDGGHTQGEKASEPQHDAIADALVERGPGDVFLILRSVIHGVSQACGASLL
jgi:hypothetical protein